MTLWIYYKDREWIFQPSENAVVDSLIQLALDHFEIYDEHEYALFLHKTDERLADKSIIGDAPSNALITRVDLKSVKS